MLQDALGKALAGLTSFEEVYRVIEIENDDDDTGGELTKSIEETPLASSTEAEPQRIEITPVGVTKADQTIKVAPMVNQQKQQLAPGQMMPATVPTITNVAPNMKEIPVKPVAVANVQTVNQPQVNYAANATSKRKHSK